MTLMDNKIIYIVKEEGIPEWMLILEAIIAKKQGKSQEPGNELPM